MTTLEVRRGIPVTLTVEWRLYAGGPFDPVTGTTIAITPVAGGTPALAETSTGVLSPGTGLNAYVWTPAADLTVGTYLIEWSALDEDLQAVGATELITVTDVTTCPLGGPYATLAQLKARMGIADSNTARDTDLTQRLLSASRDINSWTHRQFGRSEVATTRRFPVTRTGVDLDDFWTEDELAIVPYLGQTAGTAWDVATLALEPADGVVNQVPGWPYNRISMEWGSHPLWAAASWAGYTAYVTAKWGWAAIPENVVTACLMLAVADDKAKDAPFGVAGFGDFAVRIRQNPMVEEKLKDYVIDGGLMVAS
jgi:hypothetical protein